MDASAMAAALAGLGPEERAALLQQVSGGLDAHLGLQWVSVADDAVVGRVEVGPEHLQPYGLVHGGVYCALAEAACSVGAALAVMAQGHNAVGAENHTRFLRPAREGAVLTITARPERVADGWHTWRAEVVDQDGQRCAVGKVVVRALDPGRRLAGEAVALRPGSG